MYAHLPLAFHQPQVLSLFHHWYYVQLPVFSSLVGLLESIRSVLTVCMSGCFCGAGSFGSSSKCSTAKLAALVKKFTFLISYSVLWFIELSSSFLCSIIALLLVPASGCLFCRLCKSINKVPFVCFDTSSTIYFRVGVKYSSSNTQVHQVLTYQVQYTVPNFCT